ncbi:MAG: trypsin-like peptidase domain-containing protein [Bacteroidota bacterium]
MKQSITALMIAAASFGGGAWVYGQHRQQEQQNNHVSADASLFSQTNYSSNPSSGPFVDFEKAATKAAPAVVHIRTVLKAKQVSGDMDMGGEDMLRQFFDHGNGNGRQQMQMPEQRASGSGVLISADGYIVTNNHVVEGTNQLTVTLNDKTDYKARVVGTDPSTDLAVIKIEGHNFPFLTFSNSDNVHLGQWVLAIGYPLNLSTTVTSGIVSAKSRNIGINSRNSSTPVESFIQTDAAVNPGNSGGALVNTDGDVIGINSAIASPTGSYAGYSYAIPSNLVQKVASDIIKYGSTKRAYLGIMYPSDQMSEEDRGKNNIKEGDGVFVMDVAKGSSAEEAGIEKGDFITKINGNTINAGNEMVEKIAALRPGDKMTLTYVHNGTEKNASVVLKGSTGTYASIKEQVIDQLGASFQAADNNKGVMIKQLGQGLLSDQTRIKEGFIITKVNNATVTTVDELKDALKQAGNSAVISGVYPDAPTTVYQYALNDLNGAQ